MSVASASAQAAASTLASHLLENFSLKGGDQEAHHRVVVQTVRA